MNTFTVVLAYALLGSLAIPSAARGTGPDEEAYLQQMWSTYKADFKKFYNASEDAYRYQVFQQNLQLINERNQQERAVGGDAVHGLTRFSDLTQKEFEDTYLGCRPEFKPNARNFRTTADEVSRPLPPDDNATAFFVDWTGTYTGPVRDQGGCGSCWAFAAAEQIESDVMRRLGTRYILSTQQLVSCTTTAFGCSGGWPELAYQYVHDIGGIEQESDYEYRSPPTLPCLADPTKFVVTINRYFTVKGKDVEWQMVKYLKTIGPLAVCLSASVWGSYTGGILKNCGTGGIDHCVQVVGVKSGPGGYWKLRNSWGALWGESGYIRLALWRNTCQITFDPTHVGVSNVV